MNEELLHLAILESVYNKIGMEEARRMQFDDIAIDIVDKKKLMTKEKLVEMLATLSSAPHWYLDKFKSVFKLTKRGYEYMKLLHVKY
jgi:hypothetical protein